MPGAWSVLLPFLIFETLVIEFGENNESLMWKFSWLLILDSTRESILEDEALSLKLNRY